jgi:hypothetical protein
MKPSRLYLLIILFSASTVAFAQTLPQVKYWNGLVEKASAEALGAKMRESEAPKWPRIESAYAYEQKPTNQREIGVEALRLAEGLRRQLEKSFSVTPEADEAKLKSDFQTLATINRALGSAGGYSNQVLQDSVARVMIFRLAMWLVKHPTKAEQAETLFDSIEVPRVILDSLLGEMATQDRELATKQAEIANIDREKSIYQALTPIGLGMNDVLALAAPPRVMTSELLKQPSAPALVYRMATTEALKWVNLRGLIQFLKLGGSFDELDPADVRKLDARMGKEAKQYRYPLLGIRSLTEAQMNALIDLQREPEQRRVFLDVALR